MFNICMKCRLQRMLWILDRALVLVLDGGESHCYLCQRNTVAGRNTVPSGAGGAESHGRAWRKRKRLGPWLERTRMRGRGGRG